MPLLFLVGYMGCGKSTLARKIARRLGVESVDTDRLVEEQEGAAVADIFRYEGEEHFRRIEREALERVIGRGGTQVVSTGGGLPVWGDNMERMNRAGMTVYLRRPARQIVQRMSPYGRRKRPRLQGLNDEELVGFMPRDMIEREPFYARARLTIDCATFSDEELVEIILEKVKNEESK